MNTDHTCEYMPMTFGTYDLLAPEPEVCGSPAQVRLRVTHYKDRQPEKALEVDAVVEAWSCLFCFEEALLHSGNYSDFDPTSEDLSEFDPEHGGEFDPVYGPKFEILEVLKGKKDEK